MQIDARKAGTHAIDDYVVTGHSSLSERQRAWRYGHGSLIQAMRLGELFTRKVLGASTSQAAAGASSAGPRAPTMPATAASSTSGRPIITINGDNPATIPVGATYADPGARITGPQSALNVGVHTFVDIAEAQLIISIVVCNNKPVRPPAGPH